MDANDRAIRAEAVIKAITEKSSLVDACSAAGLSVAEFHHTLGRVRDLALAYARAREIRADLWADEIVEIADKASDANKARNQIDARKWLASKHNQKVYGERIDLNVAQTISVNAALAEAQQRVLRSVCDHPPTLDAEIVENKYDCSQEPTDCKSVGCLPTPIPEAPDIFS